MYIGQVSLIMKLKRAKIVMLPTEDMTGIILHSSGLDRYHDVHTRFGKITAEKSVFTPEIRIELMLK